MTIHIEIAKGYKEGMFNLRIGDIEGHVSLLNISKEKLFEEIKVAMDYEQ